MSRREIHGQQGFLMLEGYTEEDLTERPHIAICNTWSELNSAQYHLRELEQSVRDGIWAAGGVPFVANCYGECPLHPAKSLCYHTSVARDILAAELECILAPSGHIQGAVMLGCCDKVVPGLWLAAARCNIPTVILPGGPNVVDRYKDWQDPKIVQFRHEFYCVGTCSGFGSANSTQLVAESLGMTLPRAASVPALVARRRWIANESGKQVVRLVEKGMRPSDIMTKEALENAIRLMNAMGLSANEVWHLLALARELDLDDEITIDTFDRIGRETPCITDVYPVGKGYADVEMGGPGYSSVDFDEAGGVPAVMSVLGEKYLNLDVLTVTGRTLRENIKDAKVVRREVIRPLTDPVTEQGLVVMWGNLCTSAIARPAVVPPEMMKFEGPAVVFDSDNEAVEGIMKGRVRRGDAVIVRYEGPKGGPGMPHTQAQQALDQAGVGRENCFVIGDNSTSGLLGYGPYVLYISPEAAVGGPIAAVRDGDIIEVDIPRGRLDMRLSEEEIKERLKDWKRPSLKTKRTSILRVYELYALPASQGAGIL